MKPVETREVFEQDDEMRVIELPDGSAVIEGMEADTKTESGFYDNLAETLEAFELNSLAADFIDLVEKDREARKKRDEQYEEGIRRTGLGDDAPGGANFEGASKAVHPVLAEGCVDFAARAIKELFPANGPVKTKIVGNADRKKLERAKKKRDYLNFLLTKRMRSYRDEKEILLTQLPLGGSQYEKYFVDHETRQYTMEFVPVDMVILPASAVSFYSSPRVTQLVDLTRAKFEERVRSGFYRDLRIVNEPMPDQTASERANDKIEGVEADNYNEDGLRRILEISAQTEIDEEHGPYVLHIDVSTKQVLAIYRNWREGDERKEALEWWVEDKFIPWRGSLGVGLPHLIGGLAGALTGALRALLDSAHINNSPGAVKLKGGRASGENIVIEQTQITEMEAPPGVDDVRKIVMPLPFNPPSSVLFQLLDWITAQAKGVVATAEEKIADASNQMPVGTTLALIEQGSQVFSSIHARLHESQRRGLEIICRLIRDYPNDEDLQRFGLTVDDFAENDDIEPVSDPRIFSEAQRYAQLQEQLKVVGLFPEQNWNRNELARRSMELLRTDGIDSILPPAPEPVTADPVTENVAAASKGAPLKAVEDQDHVAHLREHLRFILDPFMSAVPGQAMAGILQHCQEHLLIVYSAAANVAAQSIGMSGELGLAEGAQQAAVTMQQQLSQLVPTMQQAQQVVQQHMPQPPVDPAVQKNFEAAMAEIERKKAVDQANASLKQQEMASDDRFNQLQMTMDQRIAELGNVFKMQIEELSRQTELMKNAQDNEQHASTELAKNTQDNQTQFAIAMEKLQKEMEDKAAQRHADLQASVIAAMERLFGGKEEKPAGAESAS